MKCLLFYSFAWRDVTLWESSSSDHCVRHWSFELQFTGVIQTLLLCCLPGVVDYGRVGFGME